jgi:protoporphyrinogen oxidase
MKDKETIYIIGAGVSGLIAAYELEQEGYHPIIIEQTDEVGGRVKTIHEKGYALDLGFQVLLSAYPLAKKYLDLDALELHKLESGALIYVNDKTYRIGDPMRNWKMLFPTIFSDIGSIRDKLKVLKLNNRLKRKSIHEIFESRETTTLQYLIEFGFSSKIIERFFKPFFAGIFLESNIQTSSRMFEFVYKMFGEGYATIPKLGTGEISNQLKNKLHHTEFMFNCEVKDITSDKILMVSGENLPHDGLIIATNSTSIIRSHKGSDIKWKACMCLYFEVDQTNIPANTIALIADSGNYANNLYAYTDVKTGKTILSVTALEHMNKSDAEIIENIIAEVKKYTGALKVVFIHHYRIKQALPDIQNLKMTLQSGENQVMDNIFLAGDTLMNGSLNAAMESGRIAAKSLLEKRNLIK